MDNIVLISAPEVLQVPIEENNEAMASLYSHPEIVIDMRKQRAKEQYAVRKTVLMKLLEAHQYLLRELLYPGYADWTLDFESACGRTYTNI